VIVQAALSDHFVPCRIDVKDESNAGVVERYRQAWTPDFRVTSAGGDDLYRWNGFLPPAEFVAQLLMAAGYSRLALRDPDASVALLEELLRRFPTSAVAAEAMYYLAVARFKVSKDRGDLEDGFDLLRRRHPNSIWREKQIYEEGTPAP
jgi:hypothetical protein